MKLSILITHYNEPEEVVKPLLDSILLQHGIDKSDFEVIIMNDGDKKTISEDTLNYYSNKLPLKYFISHHDGVSATRNKLLDKAKGEYVMWCDCDDMFASILALRLIFQEIDKSHFDLMYNSFYEEIYVPEENKKEFILRENDSTFVHGKVIRKDFLKKINLKWNNDLKVHEDSYFFGLAYHLCDKNKFVMGKQPFYLWKWRDDSVVRKDKDFSVKTYKDLIKSNTALIEEFLRRGLDDQASQYMFLMTFRLYYSVNKVEFLKPENEHYLEEIEKYFKPIYEKYVGLMENIDSSKQLRYLKKIRSDMFNEYLMLEKITFEDWTKRVLER